MAHALPRLSDAGPGATLLEQAHAQATHGLRRGVVGQQQDVPLASIGTAEAPSRRILSRSAGVAFTRSFLPLKSSSDRIGLSAK